MAWHNRRNWLLWYGTKIQKMHEIVIKPANKEVLQMAEAVKLRSEIMSLGFNTRRSFLKICLDYLPAYHTLEGTQELTNWWLYRLRDTRVNNDVAHVIKCLKNE